MHPLFHDRRAKAIAATLVTTLGLAGGVVLSRTAEAVGPKPTPSALQAVPGAGKGNVRGTEALARLGGRVGAVAAAHGMSAAELQARLEHDDTLYLDPTDRLLNVEPAPVTATTATGPAVGNGTPYPESQTFQLHSRPGASRVIYLDFDGYVTSGTAWNQSYPTADGKLTSGPFDTDGNPAVFSSSEMAVVQGVWQRVAEDYAPWDVDVTTQDPGTSAIDRPVSTDTVYGTRAVITNDAFLANAGGVAYVGIYDMVGGDYYKPAFIFAGALAYGTSYIAEAVSHEVGHNLGLSHDGVIGGASYYEGQGVWAPIMGVGYYKSVVQFSKGEYLNANNTEDDLAVIASHGLAIVPDDFGDTPATATVLTGPTISASGIIRTRTDVDAVKFTMDAGPVTLNAAPAAPSGDLDIGLQLLDANGAVVAANDGTGLAASITATLPAGTYTLLLDGVGSGTASGTGYSDYASIGRWFLDGTVPATTTTTTTTTVAPTTTTVAPTTTTTTTTTTTVAPTTTLVTTTTAATKTVFVKSVVLTTKVVNGSTYVVATVTVVDASGVGVPNATVTGNFSGAVSGGASGVTASSGVATITSKPVRKSGTVTFTVTGVTGTGLTYGGTAPTGTVRV